MVPWDQGDPTEHLKVIIIGNTWKMQNTKAQPNAAIASGLNLIERGCSTGSDSFAINNSSYLT